MASVGAMRFISEAQAANQIRSRYIVDVFSFGKLPDGRHFFVMDLLDGQPLDRYIADAAPVAVPDAIQLLSLIAEALDAAHAAGIVHRDLKPQNIFLVWEANGETVPKLLDFGMAKLVGQAAGVQTASGAVMGTPLYMAPEQALGKKVDGRADVYALGILAHELLTGKRPISGETAMGVLAAHLTVVPPRASEVHAALDPRLDAPILRMLEKNPEDRPATAGVAIADLKRAAEEAGHVIRGEGPRLPRPEQAPKSVRATTATSGEGSSAPPDLFGSERGLEREVRVRTGDASPARSKRHHVQRFSRGPVARPGRPRFGAGDVCHLPRAWRQGAHGGRLRRLDRARQRSLRRDDAERGAWLLRPRPERRLAPARELAELFRRLGG
jgi:serine/threonine protein kinase